MKVLRHIAYLCAQSNKKALPLQQYYMPPKTIAVSTRFLVSRRLEGVARFTLETLQRITPNHPEHRFVFLFERPYSEEFIFSDNITPRVVFPPARHPFLWYWWFEWSIPRILRQVKADVFLSPDGFCSLSTPVKTAMVVHDIAFEHYPEQVPFLARKYYTRFSGQYARRANRLVAVSEYTKQDLVTTYGISPQKIDVVYNGVNSIYAPLTVAQQQAVQQQFAGGNPYFLFVGAIHPRKNLANILRAFDQLKAGGNCNALFLVAGRHAWQCHDAMEVYQNMQHKNSVQFLGHLQQEELAQLMGGALALVYASVFEGFGIPIVEAMCAETAVITSNSSSMPEVAGNAALLINPHSPNSICTAMQQLFFNPGLRNSLIEKGRLQRTRFSWDESAQKLWQCVEKLL
ncbi:glycosyltransferase family 1 protein [Sphingobacteriales bacterium UPWRP_1]|nr:hypothetical protein B6N25_04630 [Sphingobacteriales bacterium TSM_CSS]PSJ77755.1 glycosyltransferase family 1 protein [Sphingobacteriales bacterium UPWRP_1]